jgi:hypothetical protein
VKTNKPIHLGLVRVGGVAGWTNKKTTKTAEHPLICYILSNSAALRPKFGHCTLSSLFNLGLVR